MAAGLLLVACTGAPDSTAPPDPDVEVAVDERLEARCGSVVMPVTDQPSFPSAPIDSDTQALVDGTPMMGFDSGQYEWSIAEQSDDRILLFGRPLAPMRPGEPGFADALFEKREQQWELKDFGQCRLEIVAPGFGPGRWIHDPGILPDPDSNQVSIMTMERSCASGRAPIGRQVLPVLVEDADRVIITVSVERVAGPADCPGNPWHPIVVELEQPIGDRVFFDGNTFPPIERPWPPTQSSLTSLGDP